MHSNICETVALCTVVGAGVAGDGVGISCTGVCFGKSTQNQRESARYIHTALGPCEGLLTVGVFVGGKEIVGFAVGVTVGVRVGR